MDEFVRIADAKRVDTGENLVVLVPEDDGVFYCIFINIVLEGPVPAVWENSADDPAGLPGRVCVFATEREAQVEIVENMMVRLREFLDGDWDFDDAVTLEEYVVEVGKAAG